MRRLLFLFIAFLTLSADLVEYPLLVQKEDTQAKFKAVYIYGFTKYFEWINNKEGNFVITILGENAGLVNELSNIAKTRMVGTQKMEIKNYQTITEVEATNILYITPDKSGMLANALSKFKGKSVLIITEKQGLAKGGATINFIVEESKQKFELNKTAASKAGLTMSAGIEKLAANVFN
ncbi:MAG: YfiR family protein [Bacteroidia bacterium]